MPDVRTKHPDIVRDVLKEAGFTCGVEGRFVGVWREAGSHYVTQAFYAPLSSHPGW